MRAAAVKCLLRFLGIRMPGSRLSTAWCCSLLSPKSELVSSRTGRTSAPAVWFAYEAGSLGQAPRPASCKIQGNRCKRRWIKASKKSRTRCQKLLRRWRDRPAKSCLQTDRTNLYTRVRRIRDRARWPDLDEFGPLIRVRVFSLT